MCVFPELKQKLQGLLEVPEYSLKRQAGTNVAVFVCDPPSAHVQKAPRERAAPVPGGRRPVRRHQAGGAAHRAEHRGEQTAHAGPCKHAALPRGSWHPSDPELLFPDGLRLRPRAHFPLRVSTRRPHLVYICLLAR